MIRYETAAATGSHLAIDAIRADDRCQPRAMFDSDLVSQYAEAMANGDAFPAVTVFHDGVDNFLADGFHRYHAAKSLGLADIAVTVKDGTLRDAILFSCGANSSHGWRRSNDDKRRAVLRLLNDAEWSQWSDREIARRCLVSDKTVGNLRPKHTAEIPQYEPRTFVHPKTGQPTQMRTANIGSAPKPFAQDRPIFDATPSGERWQDKAEPVAVAEITSANRETWLTNTIWEIVKLQKQLPEPKQAASRFPSILMHSINEADLLVVSTWFLSFAAEIKARKEVPNVEAE